MSNVFLIFFKTSSLKEPLNIKMENALKKMVDF